MILVSKRFQDLGVMYYYRGARQRRPFFDARGGSQTIVDLGRLSQLCQIVIRPLSTSDLAKVP